MECPAGILEARSVSGCNCPLPQRRGRTAHSKYSGPGHERGKNARKGYYVGAQHLVGRRSRIDSSGAGTVPNRRFTLPRQQSLSVAGGNCRRCQGSLARCRVAQPAPVAILPIADGCCLPGAQPIEIARRYERRQHRIIACSNDVSLAFGERGAKLPHGRNVLLLGLPLLPCALRFVSRPLHFLLPLPFQFRLSLRFILAPLLLQALDFGNDPLPLLHEALAIDVIEVGIGQCGVAGIDPAQHLAVLPVLLELSMQRLLLLLLVLTFEVPLLSSLLLLLDLSLELPLEQIDKATRILSLRNRRQSDKRNTEKKDADAAHRCDPTDGFAVSIEAE